MADKFSIIYGIAGLELTGAEINFFKDINPFGYILFARNIDNPQQLRKLCDDIRSISGDIDIPILIDQEGGRVQRMHKPHWQDRPPAKAFGDLWQTSPSMAERAVVINSMLIAADLNEMGININCAPLIDLPIKSASNAIGDRAFSNNIDIAVTLAKIQADSFLNNGIMPIVKHIPGHGRAMCDSHLELPIVDSIADILIHSDFAAFKSLNHLPLAMTAHVVFSAFDRNAPATSSKIIIDDIIRGQIGFQGLLLTDDLSMKALSGNFSVRAKKCLAAGCDIILHCNGKMDEMIAVANGANYMSDLANKRWAMALEKKSKTGYIDKLQLQNELNIILDV